MSAQFAGATYDRIRPDATMRDVIAVAEHYWEATGSECSAGIESFKVFTPGLLPSGSVLVRRWASKGADKQEELPFGDKAALLRIFDGRTDLGSCRHLNFTFRVPDMPPRTSLSVQFGEDGRVIRVAPPHTWD